MGDYVTMRWLYGLLHVMGCHVIDVKTQTPSNALPFFVTGSS
jgi:hypothetical protein